MGRTDIDYSKYCTEEGTKKHAEFFPNDIFAILAGSTGCGKTNLMLNFLLNHNLDYDDVIIYTKTPDQKYYKLLRNFFDGIKKKYGVFHNIISFCDDAVDMKDPSQLDNDKNHVIIFDDVLTENQKVMTDYFCRGRHGNCAVFYLTQSLHKLPKHGIRQNANIFILFSQDDKTLKYFYDSNCAGDMPFNEFKKLCDDAWLKEHGFVVINLWENPSSGKYMQNYETIFIPTKYSKILENN